LSIIDDTIYARNRLYLWVYAHHKVTYIDYLLRYAVLYSLLDNKENKFDYTDYINAKEKLEVLLNLNIFDKTQAKDNYLIDDSKFITRISEERDKNTFAEKYLSRTKEYSVWKSFAEYNRFFYDLTTEEKKKIWESLFVGKIYQTYETTYKEMKEGKVQMFPDSILKDYESNYDFVWVKPSGYKVNKIESSETYLVSNDGSVRRFQDVIEKDKTTEEYVDKNYFYLYTAKEMDNNEKFKLISFLKSKIREL
jgi:HD superfamily phosphohydrolase